MAERLLAVQRAAGNQATLALLGAQAKLDVGAAGDAYEQEADRVARAVVDRLAGQATDEGAGAPDPVDLHQASGEAARRREVAGLRRAAEVGLAGGELSEETEGAIQAARQGGRPLEPGVRRTMEGAFGADFSSVRVHTGSQATALNEAVQAKAFTVGADVFFRGQVPDPRTSEGQGLLAHELTHVVQQGAAPGREVTTGRAEAAQRLEGDATAPARVQRNVVNIGNEQVEVADVKEEAEARDIIEALKNTYGVDVNSEKGVDAIKDQYTSVPKDVLDSLSTRRWRMVELRAVLATMEHYAQILGSERETSTRKGSAQEVIAVGKVTQAIDSNTSAGELDTTTLGEYFAANKTMNLFKAQEGQTDDFPGDEMKQLVGTFVHEMAHGLLAYAYNDFVKASGGFWTDQVTKSGKDGAEAPITDYGAKNAREDLCETAMFYFVEPETLKNGRGEAPGSPGNPAPLRYAFMEKITNKWLPPPPPPVTTEPPTGNEVSTSKGSKPKPEKKPWWRFWK
ncbi:MAG: DUF4157 domain-containing protein [Actinomycetota bacterium]|nr:DUF4157 domain-containing protein [Actinomycetota bacterium]